MARYRIDLWDTDDGKVRVEITPPIDQATVAAHAAKLKIDGVGLGPAMGYLTASLDAMMRRHKGIHGDNVRPSILWTPQ